MIIKNLKISRMPGFRYGLNKYDTFAKGINVIAGPNGSGKSSTARLIRQLLWKTDAKGVEASTELNVEGEVHRIEISGSSYIHYDGNGRRSTDDFSYITPIEFSDQYLLALHDLVNDTNSDLAKNIIKELSGGVDLDENADKLNYSEVIPNRRKGEYTDFSSRKKSYDNVCDTHKKLEEEGGRLAELEKQKREAEESSKYVALLKLIIKYLEISEELDKLSFEFDSFPLTLSSFRKDDPKRVEEGIKAEDSLNEEKRAVEREIERFLERIDSLKISKNGDEQENFNLLKEYYFQLEGIHREIERLDSELLTAGNNLEDAKIRVDNYSLDALSNEITLKDINSLEKLIGEKNKISGERKILEKDILELEIEHETDSKIIEPGFDVATIDKIKEGVMYLSNWLKGEGSDKKSDNRRRDIFAVILFFSATIITVLLTLFFDLWGLLGLLLPIVLFLFLKKQSSFERSNLDSWQEAYETLNLPKPLLWSGKDVSECLNMLMDQIAIRHKLDELSKKINLNKERVSKLNNDFKMVDDDYLSIIATLNIGDDFFTKMTESPNTFLYFINQLYILQKASSQLKAKSEEREECVNKMEKILSNCNDLQNKLQYGAAKDITEVKMTINSIEKEFSEYTACNNELKIKRQKLESINRSITENERSLQEIYTRLELDGDYIFKIGELSKQFPRYAELKSIIDKESSLKEFNLNQIHNHERFEEGMEFMGLEDARNKLMEKEALASNFESLTTEITEIRTKINAAGVKNELGDRLAELNSATDRLQIAFEKDLRATTGDLLVNELKEEVTIKSENPILSEANKILGEITDQRYSLITEVSDSPKFKAKDNILEKWLELSELSSGTRVQLLLSVRLAYIKSLEDRYNVRLPILADELLGNSDDKRSQAIIDALIKISDSRQIFYFTAQGDEVARWKRQLEHTEGVEYRVIFLDKLQSNIDYPGVDIEPISLYQTVPVPDGLSHEDYREVLNVPQFDPIEQKLSELHIWYLIEDPDILYRCLSLGVNSYGQLEHFHRSNGNVDGLNSDGWSLIGSRVDLLNEFARLYKIGRSRRINREVLEQSEAISDNFIDRVTEKLYEVDGDPLQLIDRLENREVSGFQRGKLDTLTQYLIANGYIDNSEQLDSDELTTSLIAYSSRVGLAPEDADRLIKRLWQAK